MAFLMLGLNQDLLWKMRWKSLDWLSVILWLWVVSSQRKGIHFHLWCCSSLKICFRRAAKDSYSMYSGECWSFSEICFSNVQVTSAVDLAFGKGGEEGRHVGIRKDLFRLACASLSVSWPNSRSFPMEWIQEIVQTVGSTSIVRARFSFLCHHQGLFKSHSFPPQGLHTLAILFANSIYQVIIALFFLCLLR